MNTPLLLVLIGLAGGVGSIARVVLSGWIAERRGAEFGIWIVNLSGSLAIGLAFGFWTARGGTASDWQLLMVTMGFLGGFTTVSTFAVQVLELKKKNAVGQAQVLAFGSILTCPICAFVGVMIGATLGAAA